MIERYQDFHLQLLAGQWRLPDKVKVQFYSSSFSGVSVMVA